MDIWSFLRVLFRRKWLIITVTLTAVLATFFITKKLPQDYKSKATLATGITANTDLSMEEDGSSNPYVISTRFSNLIEQIHSRRIINLLSYRLILHDLQSNQPFRELESARDEYSQETLQQANLLYQARLDSMQTLGATDKMDWVLLDILQEMDYDEESLRENLKIERPVGSDFINISFISEDPHLSAYVVNALSEEFMRYYKTNKVRRVETSLNFFTDMVEKKKGELDEKVATLRQYKEKNSVINYGAQSASMLNRIAQLQSNQEDENKTIVGLRQAIRNIDSQLQGKSDTDFGAQAGQSNQQMIVLRNKITELNNRYVNGNMQSQVLADSLAMYRARLDRLIGSSNDENLYRPGITRQELASMKVKNQIELEMAQARLSSINNELSELERKAYGFSENEGEIAGLESDIEVAREEYLQVLDKYNTARNASLSVANRLEQIEVGEPAYEPETSRRILMIAVAGAASFSLCIVLIFFLEFVNMKVDSPSKFKTHVRLPLLGTLNKVNLSGFDLKAIFSGQDKDENRETYKQLLRKVRYEVENKKAHSILVTSNKPGEGKTFTIISLSYALSLLGKRVLIIDTNFKNNTLTKLFLPKRQAEKYLEESTAMRGADMEQKLLAGGSSESEGEQAESTKTADHNGLITPTRLQGIDLIASKGGNLSPAEIFMSKDFQELLKELEKEYDYIMLEGPAMNQFADTKELVNFVDKVITIFSAESVLDQTDRETINYLKNLDGKLIGTILNKVEPYNLNL